MSQIDPFDQFEIPTEWAAAFPKLAAEVPEARGIDPAEAGAYVGQLVDPALTSTTDAAVAVWVPGAGWTPPDDVAATEAAVAEDIAGGGDVYVRHRTRGGLRRRGPLPRRLPCGVPYESSYRWLSGVFPRC